MADADRVANTAVAEDEQIGGSEAPNGVPGEAAPVADETQPNLEISQSAGVQKAEVEEKPEKPAEKPAAKLPWNPDRQTEDQRSAKLEKRLAQAEHVIEELRNPKPDLTVELDAATAEFDELIEGSPDEFADEAEVKAHKAKLAKVSARIKAAKVALNEKPKEKPKADPGKPAAEPDKAAPTIDDFNAMCVDAEIEFGSQFSDVGRASCIREMGRLGFNESKWPTKAQLAKLVTRVFAEVKGKTEAKSAANDDGTPAAGRERREPASRPYGRKVRTWDEIQADVVAQQARNKKR